MEPVNTTDWMARPEIRQLKDADFDREVLQSERPVVLAFFSAWSPACEMVEGSFCELACELTRHASVYRVSVDDNPDLTAIYDVNTIPTLLCVVGGRERMRIVGTCRRETVLGKLLPLLADAGEQ